MRIYVLSGIILGFIFLLNSIILMFGFSTIGTRGKLVEPSLENIVEFIVFSLLSFGFSIYLKKKSDD